MSAMVQSKNTSHIRRRTKNLSSTTNTVHNNLSNKITPTGELCRLFQKLRFSTTTTTTITKSSRTKVTGKKKDFLNRINVLDHLQINSPYRLLSHQKKILNWIHNTDKAKPHNVTGGIVCLEMGLGKTLIGFCSVLMYRKRTSCSLMVCYKTLVNSILLDFRKFFGYNASSIKVFHKGMDIDVDNFSSNKLDGTDILLATYDTILSLYKIAYIKENKNNKKVHNIQNKKRMENARLFFSYNWFRVIADESQKFGSPRIKITSAMMMLKSQYRLCLTGTPIRNCSEELRTQLRFCGLSELFVWSLSSFKKNNLAELVFRMSTQETGIKLPPIQSYDIHITFNQREQALYDQVLLDTKQLYHKFNKYDDDANNNVNRKINSSSNILVQFVKLRQICLCSTLIDPSITIFSISKFQAIRAILSHHIPNTDKVIIFSSFVKILLLLKHYLNTTYYYYKQHNLKEKILMITGQVKLKTRNSILSRFATDTESQVLLMSSQTGSLGLNITTANHVIIMEPWYNTVMSKQARARVWRIGQQKTVHVWYLLVKNTIEVTMYDICKQKDDTIRKFLPENILNILFKA